MWSYERLFPEAVSAGLTKEKARECVALRRFMTDALGCRLDASYREYLGARELWWGHEWALEALSELAYVYGRT